MSIIFENAMYLNTQPSGGGGGGQGGPSNWGEIGGNILDQGDLQAQFSTKQDTITDLESYVKNTDYATGSKGGVFKYSSAYAVSVSSNGYLVASVSTPQQYSTLNNTAFISKGTLENVRLDKSVEEWQFTLATGEVVVRKVVLGE